MSTVKIQCKAGIIAKEMNIENFEGGPTWCYRFMKQKKLSVWALYELSVGQELPENWEEKTKHFENYV